MTTATAAVTAPVAAATGHELADRLLVIKTWMYENLWITDKQGNLVRLETNDEQDRILLEMLKQEMNGYPVRLIILKARKVGCSTIIEAYGYYKCHHESHTRAFVTAQDDEACITIFSMTGQFHRYNPVAKDLITAGKRELLWAPPHDSRFSVQTAGKTSLARGDTVHYLHCSEIPFWPQQKTTLTSVLNAVPDNSGVAVLESTAQGYEEFKERWDKATKNRKENPGSLEGFTPLFFSWLDHAPYRRSPPEGYIWGDLDEYEVELQDLGANYEQLYWRRIILEDKCGGDPQIFMQEFPATDKQAFLTSGRKKISAVVLKKHAEMAAEAGPGRRFRFHYRDGKLVAQEGDWPDMYWELWEMPEPICGYTVGGDISEGLLSDPGNARSEPDRTTAYILNRRTLTQAGRWQGRTITESEFGREMTKVAIFFNRAWAGPEVNSIGKAAALAMAETGYDHQYQWRKLRPDEEEHNANPAWGWKTTGGMNGTRDMMITDWVDVCKPRKGHKGESAWERRMHIKSVQLAEEETTFVVRPNGRVEHSTGKHDDELFAAMIAYELHLACEPYEINATEDDMTPTDISLLPGPSHGFVGGTDEHAQRRSAAIAVDKARGDDEQIWPNETI